MPKIGEFNHNAEINTVFRQDVVENSEALILDLWFPVVQSTINKHVLTNIFLFELKYLGLHGRPLVRSCVRLLMNAFGGR